MTAGDIAIITTLGSSVVAGIVMLIKAGPAWNQSVAKNLRDELESVSTSLDEERAERKTLDKELRQERDVSQRLRWQLERNGITPFDDEGRGP
jgi:septal ring factor EnvC (AmiA/AmiB activator)